MRPSSVFRAWTLGACSVLSVATASELARAQTPGPAPSPADPSAAPTLSPNATPPLGPNAAPSPLPSGELSVRISDEQGTVFLDGREVGQGSYQGVVSVGRHQLRVTREGYDTYEVWLDIEAGQVRSESVSLRQSVTALPPSRGHGEGRSRDGLYGGIQLLGVFQPTGTGTTFEDACDTIGATSCAPATPLGAGLAGYVGWLFEPLGLELALTGTAQVQQPSASFDGEHGSEINPLVATPAREEKFTIGHFGGSAALRARFWLDVSRVRFTVAAGPGLAYRSIAWERETTTPDGFTDNTVGSGIDYLSPQLSLEAGAALMVTRSLGITLGFTTWFESAGDNARSEPRNDTLLYKDEKTRPVPLATPAYDMANGIQWYIGPYLGVSFGP